MFKKILSLCTLLVFAGLIAGPASAARLQEVYNPEPIAVPPGKSLEQVKSAIHRGLVEKGFVYKDIGPNQVQGKYTRPSKKGDYVAVFDVKYDTTSVRISYKNSENLNYDSGNIHPTYNKWIHTAENYIRLNLEK